MGCVKDRKVLTCTVPPGEEDQPMGPEIPRSLAACEFLINKSQVAIDTYCCQKADGNYWTNVLWRKSNQVNIYFLQIAIYPVYTKKFCMSFKAILLH